MIIRVGHAADAVELAHVFQLSRAAAMPYLPVLYTSEEIRRWMANVVLVETQVWVGVGDGGEILGFASVEGATLEHLYLRPQSQRRGLGSALLETVLAASPDQLVLRVFQRNRAAIDFYLGHGFAVTDHDDGQRNEETEPDQTMTWTRA